MPEYKIHHITRYTYPTPVIDSANQVMLYPLEDQQQEVKKHEIRITNNPALETFTDYFGNKVGIFSVIEPHTDLTIESFIEVVIHETKKEDDGSSAGDQWNKLAMIRDEFPYMDLMLLEHGDSHEEILATVNSLIHPTGYPFDIANQLSSFVYTNFEYKKGITSVETIVDEIWKLKAGVCQDFAHVLLVMLRMAGIPARYVSGYICPHDKELRGENATHAWVEAYIPFRGWVGFDPTNNCIASDRHVRLAIGRSFTDCTPVKGTYKGSSEHTLQVSVRIENGSSQNEEKPTAVFTSQVKNPGLTDNSYRQYMEMMQQQ